MERCCSRSTKSRLGRTLGVGACRPPPWSSLTHCPSSRTHASAHPLPHTPTQILPSLLLVSLTSSSPKSSAGPSRAVGALERGLPHRARSCLQFVRYLGGRCNAAAGAGHEPGHYHWAVNVAGTQANSPCGASHVCRGGPEPGRATSPTPTLTLTPMPVPVPVPMPTPTAGRPSTIASCCRATRCSLWATVSRRSFILCSAWPWAHYPNSQRESCNPSPTRTLRCADEQGSFRARYTFCPTRRSIRNSTR